MTRVKWNSDEDALLLRLRNEKSHLTFNEMCQYFPGKNMKQIAYRFKKLTKGNIKKYWSREEDVRLVELIENNGENFNKLVPFFQDKTASDIETRYYKKIKHLKLGFTAEEDEIVLKLYRKRQLSLHENHILRGKGHIEIMRRLETLLSSNGEQMNKSFNASSIFSSSCSSTANLDHNWKMDIDDEGMQPHLNPQEVHHSWCEGNLCDCSHYNPGSTMQNNGNSKNKHKNRSEQNENKQNSAENYFGNLELDYNCFYSDLIKDNGKGNYNIYSKQRDNDLSDTYTNPSDLNDSCIQRLNEPDDSFEASFYSAFKIQGNDNFLDLDEDEDIDKALNQASSSTALANFISKKRSLEQILNKIHGISKSCFLDIESKAKFTLTQENLIIFNDLSQKLQQHEQDYKQALDSERYSLASKKLEVSKGGDQELIKGLGRQIEYLMKLIQINKMKLKLFKRAAQRKT